MYYSQAKVFTQRTSRTLSFPSAMANNHVLCSGTISLGPRVKVVMTQEHSLSISILYSGVTQPLLKFFLSSQNPHYKTLGTNHKLPLDSNILSGPLYLLHSVTSNLEPFWCSWGGPLLTFVTLGYGFNSVYSDHICFLYSRNSTIFLTDRWFPALYCFY